MFAPPRLRLVVGLTICSCLGCSARTYRVSGTVEFDDGTPAVELASGFVSFRSVGSDNTSAQAVIKPDGSFVARTFAPGDGLVPGKHQVAVTPPPYAGRESRVLPPPPMAARFMQFETSGLEVNVEGPISDLKLKVQRFRAP